MKKILLAISLAVGLASTIQAQNTFYGDFLGGNRYVWITNNTTYNYNDTSVPFLNAQSNYVFSLTNLYESNGIPFTNAAAGQLLLTNQATYFGLAWQDMVVPSDANGVVQTAAIGVIYTPYTTNTNSITLTFARLVPNYNLTGGGSVNTNWVAGTSPTDTWSFSLTNAQTSLAPIATVTNIPSGFLQGSPKIRLQSAKVGNNAASGAFLNAVRFQGYSPTKN